MSRALDDLPQASEGSEALGKLSVAFSKNQTDHRKVSVGQKTTSRIVQTVGLSAVSLYTSFAKTVAAAERHMRPDTAAD